jgi:hypothetical protein
MELSGTRSELTELRDAILRFCTRKRPLLEVPVDQEADPAPYESRLSGLRLIRAKDKLRILIEGQRLFITGRLDLLEVFARALPCAAEQVPSQVRFDAVDRVDHVEPDSLGIVLTLTS